MNSRRRLIFLLALMSLGLHGPSAPAAPKLASVYPMGGKRGTAVEVEVRGSGLEGTYAVWLGAGCEMVPQSAAPANLKCTKSPEGIEAHVKAVPDGSRAKLQLVIAAGARVGFHSLAVVSPSGVSGSVSFWVGDHAVLADSGAPHRTPDTAQIVKVPVEVHGRISENGQLNYYAFEVAREQTLAFEVIVAHGPTFDPQLALYEAGGSFLDPQRSRRLLLHEEITQGGMPADRRMTHRFSKPGHYLVSIGNPFAQGAGDASYLLRIAPAEPLGNADDALSWARGRMQNIRARTVDAPAKDVALLRELEPNDSSDQGQLFNLPAVVEGIIGQPGDIDRFRFKAKAGQKLAIELQTPHAASPLFTPRLDVLDAKGAVVLSNLQVREAKVGTEDAKVVQLSTQVTGTLASDGEYTLRIRDLTSTRGSPDHVYRVLVRPQLAHIGAIQVQPEGPVNLAPGGKQRLTLSIPMQEGFAGSLAISVEGVPAGVRAFVGANNVVELVADASAPITPLPQLLRILGLPVMGEKRGAPFLAAEIPIMVVRK